MKAAVPELAGLPPDEAARRLRRLVDRSRRVGLVGAVRAVEQTPELAHLVPAVKLAFPRAAIVHIVRDGRDVACSLLEKPWLRREQVKADDAGVPYGSYARFWVEPERREEFETASDARRAAWVWRSYVSAARHAGASIELRYEDLAANSSRTAAELAAVLDAPPEPLAAALSRVHAESVGRYHTDLDDAQLADVEAEAGDLLRELGYVSSAKA